MDLRLNFLILTIKAFYYNLLIVSCLFYCYLIHGFWSIFQFFVFFSLKISELLFKMSYCRCRSFMQHSPWTSLRSAAPGTTVDYGLCWITSVGLLPRQQQLEKTRLPSRVGFCSNQGHEKKKKKRCFTMTDFSCTLDDVCNLCRGEQGLHMWSLLYGLFLQETWTCIKTIGNRLRKKPKTWCICRTLSTRTAFLDVILAILVLRALPSVPRASYY